MALAFMLALWTGQRQGDLLRLTWGAYDGTFIRLKQSKGGVRVVIPVGAPLKAVLEFHSPHIDPDNHLGGSTTIYFRRLPALHGVRHASVQVSQVLPSMTFAAPRCRD